MAQSYSSDDGCLGIIVFVVIISIVVYGCEPRTTKVIIDDCHTHAPVTSDSLGPTRVG